MKLTSFGHRGTGHPCQLVVHAEVVLEGDRGERLVLFLDRNALLCLNGLMETFGVAAAFEHTAGEFVNDHDFTVADQIVDISLI